MSDHLTSVEETSRLVDVMLSVFDRIDDLQRFLITAHLPIDPPHGGTTLRLAALDVAQQVVQRELGRLFRYRLVEATEADDSYARAKKISGASERPTTDRSGSRAEFAAALAADLAAERIPDPAGSATEPARWPWTAAAAVLGSFWPTRLRPVPELPETGLSPVTALADLVFTSHQGPWVLDDEVRARCLRALLDRDELQAALRANAGQPDQRRDLVRDLAARSPLAPARMDAATLADLDAVLGWFEAAGSPVPLQRTAVRATLERRRLIDPLRALAGEHFHGRDHEIDVIRRHLHETGAPSVLVLEGPGGTGKSSLIGRVLLDLEQDPAAPPFAYLDFDKADHDPLRPAVLIDRIARQLRLRYATSSETSLHFAEIQEATDSDADLGELVDRLAGELPTALVLVLDTFEEVQIQGPGAVRSVRRLIEALLRRMPHTRVLVAGRAAGAEFPDRLLLRLGDLTADAGNDVLRHLGVTDPAVRELIISRFGANPLTLRLAAEALRQDDSGDSTVESLTTRSALLARISAEQIQGLLYARILGHLSSPEVARVAHPGLAVRRITVDVLRDVLAGPCDLDPANAERLFELLRREVSMFETEEDGTLRHRTDVRRLMLRTMLDDPSRSRQVADIHHRAIAFYQDRPGSKARAEELYHRLMAGQDMRSQRPDWTGTLRTRLMPALDEPLPAASMSWLRRHLGLSTPGGRSDWEQTEWEALTGSRARSLLEAGDPDGALQLLSERTDRLPDSRLYPLEAGAWLLRGDHETAARVLEHGIAAAVGTGSAEAQLRLAETGVELGVRSENTQRTAESARAAVAWCDQTGRPIRAVRVLCRAAPTAPETREDLGRRFIALSRRDVRSDPGLVSAVLHTVGADQPAVLWHAAEHCGDVTGRDSVFLPDPPALTRLLNGAPETTLRSLAAEVGLILGHRPIADLASALVKHDRLGRAVQTLLTDDATVAPLIVARLVRQPAERTLLP